MSDELRFDGKVAIVTGAGNGLGRQHALMFGERGAKVVVNDLGGGAFGEGKSSEAADRVVEEIRAMGGEAVANYDSVEDGSKIVQTALDAFGTVDIVVNNAGILRDTSFAKMTEQDWDLIYRVHLLGSFRVTHAAWPIMREKGYGRIIMTASAAGIYGNFGQTNYSMAKLGLFGFCQSLALEGASKNILANTIAPVAASRLTETVLPPELLANLKPEFVSPLVGWLCHEQCEENGGLFEVGAGTFNKLRWERTNRGNMNVKAPITVDSVAKQWDKITDFTNADHPASVTESFTGAIENINNPPLGGNEFIDLDAAKAAPPAIIENQYTERDLSLYALGVGVGAHPLAQNELQYVFERGDTFYALPTYGVIPALNGFIEMLMLGDGLPGFSRSATERVLHGEQYTEILRPLPAHAKLRHEAKLRTAYDKGKDAVTIIDIDTFDEDGDKLAYNEVTFMLRGCGGWGGDRGPSVDVNTPPEREPDAVVEEKVGEDQALLYRLSGDWNPLHIDPEFAKNFGFERPILHGMCTYGYVGRHIIQSFLDNDPRRFKSIKVRLAKSVYPGDTLVTRMWKESDTRIVFETRVKERDEVVIRNAAAEFYEEIPVKKAKPKAVAASATKPVATGPTSADIFTAIGAFLAANPEKVKEVSTIFQFNLSDPDSVWTVDARDGKVVQGAAEKPDVTLSISDDNFLGMVVRGEDSQKLFFGGKLKIAGNITAAGKLEFLQTMDKKAIEDAAAQRVAAQSGSEAGAVESTEPSGPIAADIFTAIGTYFAEKPDLAKSVDTVFQFKLKDPDADWIVDAKNATVSQGLSDSAGVTLTVSEADFLAMCLGGEDAQKLFFAGKLKIAGNMTAAGKLSFLQEMGTAPFEAATKTRLAAGGGSTAEASATPTAPVAPAKGKAVDAFAKLGSLVSAKPELFEAAKGKLIAFTVAEPDSEWLLDYTGDTPTVAAGTATADATLLVSDDAIEPLVDGTETLQSLFQHGRIRVLGDMSLVSLFEAFRALA